MLKIKLKKLFYNNKWHLPNSKSIYKFSTSEGTMIEVPNCNNIDILNSVSAACNALEKFKKFSNSNRSKILKKISEIIKKNANLLAKKESIELGKNFNNAKKEMLTCANLWSHASLVTKKKTNKLIKKKNIDLYEIQEPVGVVALIIPWNFPMIVLSERLPYILGAGNSVVIKPSENGSLSIELLIKLIENIGLPIGTINYLTGDSNTGKNLIKNKNISMISFTGSTKNGKKIYKLASNGIKRLSLELGGKNPMVIFSDADLKKASKDIIYSFIHNAGQCCVSGSKLFIENEIFQIFVEKLKTDLNKIDQVQNITTISQYKKIKKIILKSIKDKVPIIYRKEKLFDDNKKIIYPIIFYPKNKKYYLEEEIFGPVLTVSPFKKMDELINEMNNTKFGLSALLWTQKKSKAIYLASKIKFGRIWINGNISQNFPELSIGGFKESGLNRETGDSGLRTYSEIKSMIINE